MIQIGSGEGEDKPRFARLSPDQSLATITLEEALELCKLPRELGEFEDQVIKIGAGRFGPYVQHGKKFVSIPKDEDPLTITPERAVELILQKREADAKSHLLSFEEEPELEVLVGRFGLISSIKARTTRFPRNVPNMPANLRSKSAARSSNPVRRRPRSPRRNVVPLRRSKP